MKRIYCEYCGGESLVERNGVYVCAHCNTMWEKYTVDETVQKLTELLDDAKQEALANARRNLYDAVHDKYLDNVKILMCVQRVQALYPEDFYAKLYEITSGSNLRKINDYLGSIDVKKYDSYIDGAVEYLLRVMERENVMAVSNLIERAYSDKPIKYSKIQTVLETLIGKVYSDIYEVDVPRDVFIAYKSDDMPKVMELVEYLEENGVSCFVALRNLRHGRNAVGVYEEQLEKAMDSCSIVLLVSSHKSRTTGDARYKELPYVRAQDLKRGPVEYTANNNYAGLPRKYKKPRIEYIIENYKGFDSEKFIKEFFDGCTWRKTPEEVYNAIYEIQNKQIVDEENEQAHAITESGKNVKYCLNCGAENPITDKYCGDCGNSEFVDTYEKYVKEKTRRELEAEYAAKLEAERRERERMELKLKEATARRAIEEAARRAQEDAARRLQEEAARKAEQAQRAKEEAAHRAREQAERERKEQEEAARRVEDDDTVRAVKGFLQGVIDQCDALKCFDKGMDYADKGNDIEAEKWWRKAAEQGLAAAQFNLGLCYRYGRGVEQDFAEAIKWYRKAAEQGIVEAQYNLALGYYNGQGVEQDYAEAVKWYRKAAEQGFADAQCWVGSCYKNGHGVEQDYAESVRWYRKAAERGNAYAQNHLGFCYEKGQGVEQSYAEAVKWYRKAAEQGNKNAKAALERLGK